MNIGIVDWFGGNSLNYGFIIPLQISQGAGDLSRDIYVHRSNIREASKDLKKDDVVVFDLQNTWKGLAAVNVKVADAETLAVGINFADAEGYKKLRDKLKRNVIFRRLIAAISRDLFRQYSWLREDLSAAERLDLCVEMYMENAAPELATEILIAVKSLPEESVDLQDLPKILSESINFADAGEYNKFRADLKYSKPKLFAETLASLPKDLFRQYSWLREDLSATERLDLYIEMYRESAAPELATEILITVKSLPEESVDLQDLPKILSESINFDDAGEYNKFRADLKYSKPKLFAETLASLPKDLFKQYSWLREDLSATERLDLYIEMYMESAAPELATEILKLFQSIKDLSWKDLPQELSTNKNFILPVSKRITDTAELEDYFSQVPKETALDLKLWQEASAEIRLTIFKLYLDELSEEERTFKIGELIKSGLAKEVVGIIFASNNWAEIISVCTKKLAGQIFWAEILLENLDRFRQVDAAEDTLIFMIYLAAKNDKISDELITALADKIRPKVTFFRAQIIYVYFRAGYEQKRKNIPKRDELLKWAEERFAWAFNSLARTLSQSNVAVDFLNKESYLFPPCNVAPKIFRDSDGNIIRKIPCYFCEAIDWSRRMIDDYETDENGRWIIDEETGQPKLKLDKKGNPVKVESPCNYCPRLRVPDDSWKIREKKCCRIEPNLNLPAEEWSLVELVNKLGLKIFHNGEYAEKNNKDFFMRLGGEFNRLYELREHLKCRTCGKYMRDVKKTKWRTIKNLFKDTLFEHFAAFTSTIFQCQNPDCSDKAEVYLSYCWHCKGIIDSRDSNIKINGYYLCENCGAGYKDAVDPARQCLSCGQSRFQLISTNFGAKLRCANCGYEETLPSHFFHAIFPATLCPSCLKCESCNGTDFEIIGIESGAKLKCRKCGKEMLAPLTIKKDADSDSSKDFRCTKCKKTVQREKNNLERQEKRNSLKDIHWAK